MLVPFSLLFAILSIEGFPVLKGLIVFITLYTFFYQIDSYYNFVLFIIVTFKSIDRFKSSLLFVDFNCVYNFLDILFLTLIAFTISLLCW